MKIRNGFVSNSSSSSFVVLLPKDFESQIGNLDLSEYDNGDGTFGDDGETTEAKIRKELLELVRSKSLWAEESYAEYQVIEEIMRELDLIIAVVDGGPDESKITVADADKVQKILSKVS